MDSYWDVPFWQIMLYGSSTSVAGYWGMLLVRPISWCLQPQQCGLCNFTTKNDATLANVPAVSLTFAAMKSSPTKSKLTYTPLA